MGPASRWQDDAACRGLGPDLFFLERGQSSASALATCARCLVQYECAEAGMDEQFGIWGGLQPRLRRRMRRRGETPSGGHLLAQDGAA